MKYIYTALFILALQGCGTSSEDSRQQKTPSVAIDMELNKSYTVYRGDKLIKTSEETQVSIVKNTQDETSTVTLIQGSANILRR